jgi:predicted Fe-Mo cluster-binding NifX family protein
VCDHLARSSAFVVLEIENGRVASQAVRRRESGLCGNHRSFVEMLEGCEAVICGGIGQGAFDSLRSHGIRPVVAPGARSIGDAADRYLAGNLPTTGDRVCLCR